MTWAHRIPESSETIVTKVSCPDGLTQDWSIVKMAGAGKIMREIDGRSIRQEPEEAAIGA